MYSDDPLDITLILHENTFDVAEPGEQHGPYRYVITDIARCLEYLGAGQGYVDYIRGEDPPYDVEEILRFGGFLVTLDDRR